MTQARVLVAGIGNIFLGDDGFGVEVVRRLRETGVPAGVEAAGFGIRGVHLAYELADGRYDAAVLVEAVSRGEQPGTLDVIEPDAAEASYDGPVADAHSVHPAAVLAWVQRIGVTRTRVLIVGCEPAVIDESFSMSPEVAARVDEAADLVRAQVARSLAPVATPCA